MNSKPPQVHLQEHLNNLWPGIHLDRWAATDHALAQRVDQFFSQQNEPATESNSSALLSSQARYLAEEVCLDTFRQRDFGSGLFQYLKRYVTMHFPNDQVRAGLINRMCHEATRGKATAQSAQLLAHLSKTTGSVQHRWEKEAGIDEGGEPIPLAEMKMVSQPTRFEDVVFLPADAHIIVVGDIHGDLTSVQQVIQQIEDSRAIEQGAFVVFLGDYVHNGTQSWRALLEILSFQQRHSNAVILLSGNHEFRESYLTVLDEYFCKHWERAESPEVRKHLPNRRPQDDKHYGHLRLDLIRNFGFEEGEKLHDAFSEWGIRRPAICIAGSRMFSHSLGIRPNQTLTLSDLLTIKQDDAPILRTLGYETWNARRQTPHSALVNNRIMTANLLDTFGQLLAVDEFVVGHCHYRSGDTVELGGRRVTTVVSSEPTSPDSGTYMFRQMMVDRSRMRAEEGLSAEDAVACTLHSRADSSTLLPL